MIRWLAAVAGGVACLAPPAAARELWRSGDAFLDVSGSLRELARVTHGTDRDDFANDFADNLAACAPAAAFPDCPAFGRVGDAEIGTSLTRLRTRVELRVSRNLSAVVVYDDELFGGTLATFESELGEQIGTGSWIDAEGHVDFGSGVDDWFRWQHSLYRGYAFLETEHVEAVVGRQRIPWGVGRLWNPIDRFNAIPPLALEADQSPGVDAALVRWLFSGFTFLEAVAAPQDDLTDGSYAMRLHGVLRDVDYSLVAGVFEQAWTAGFDLAGNVGGSAARIEVVYTHPERKVFPVDAATKRTLGDFWQVVVSADHLFDVGNGLYALVEHLYNGNDLGFGKGRAGVLLPFFEQKGGVAVPASSDRFGGSRVVTLAANQTGAQLGYDVTPEIRGEIVAIYDWDGSSAAFFPSVRYSPTDWAEVTLGVQLFVGKRRSQYGSAENLAYLLAEFFF